VQQRVLPVYRAPFFDLLADSCEGISLIAGKPSPDEGVTLASGLRNAKYVNARNIHLFRDELYLCYQQGLTQWLKDWNPDALIMEANPRYLSTASAIRWMQARGRKVLGWGLGAPPLSGPASGFRKRRRVQFLRQFDALIAYSQRGADEYAALGFPQKKIFVAYNSVVPAPTSRPTHPILLHEPCIIFVGRLQARKRVDWLVRACAEIGSKPRLIIVGDGPERSRLESQVKEVYPAAEFIGTKHGSELTPWFAEADLFVLPGTGGLAVQEAMSHGLPVIVARGDGTQDDLVRTGNGWQIPPEDHGALVSTMREALSDMERLRRMGEESFRIVSEEINIGKMVETFVQALNMTTKG
jgi:glycosyltransferase involved in cell wall biosynthesis